jgi:peptidoglycan/LPS O-acetylase OafA/YrhL
MRQIIIRMLVAIAICALTSVIRFATYTIVSSTFSAHAESIWVMRLILASLLSPLLYRFLEKQTARWVMRTDLESCRPAIRPVL